MPLLRYRRPFFRTAGLSNLEFLTALLIIRDEELFDLRQKGLAHVGNGSEILVFVRMDRRAENPAVFLGFAFLRLLSIDDADDSHIDQAADMSWLRDPFGVSTIARQVAFSVSS
jgi:hypothetical protein